MSLSLLLVQDNRMSPDVHSLLVAKIPHLKIDNCSSFQLQQEEVDISNYELIITNDKSLKHDLYFEDIVVIVWKALSDLSAKIDAFLQLSRYLLIYPLKLTDWTLTEVLDDSDESVIYKAEDFKGKPAVVKRFKFKPSHLSEKRIRSFIAHINKQCTLNFNGLVHFYEGGINDEAFYLVMEYMKHGTLRQSINSCGDTLPKTHALEWFYEIVLALDVVHKAGLIHRDLKIDNIMLRSDGALALMDYGVSKRILLDAGFIIESELHCSPHYVSPEQISGDACTQSSDIYSLGVIFYELLTGHKPYYAKEAHELMMHHVMAPVPVFPEELKAYQPILDKLMAKNPADRVAHAIDVINIMPIAA